MTKQEAINYLSDTKVYVDGKSKEIQEKLFEIGFTWCDMTNYKAMLEIREPFLYMFSDKRIYAGSDMINFKNKNFREIKAEDILNLKIDKEYDLKPFDKVLVRDCDDQPWRIELYEKYDEENKPNKYICLSCWYRQCIPFEGNEHLLGTTDKPE